MLQRAARKTENARLPRPRWQVHLAVPVCPGLRDGPGSDTFSSKIGAVLGTPGRAGHQTTRWARENQPPKPGRHSGPVGMRRVRRLPSTCRSSHRSAPSCPPPQAEPSLKAPGSALQPLLSHTHTPLDTALALLCLTSSSRLGLLPSCSGLLDLCSGNLA